MLNLSLLMKSSPQLEQKKRLEAETNKENESLVAVLLRLRPAALLPADSKRQEWQK